jgi:hypothetical protein
VKKLPAETIVLRLPSERISKEDVEPPVRTWHLKKRYYLVLLDNADRYAEETWIAEIIERLKEKNPVSILATLRTGDEYTKARKGTLFKQDRFNSLLIDKETVVKLRDLTDEEGREIAKGTGSELPAGFDSVRTPGIIVSGWDDFKKRYEGLPDDSHPRLLMKASRLLLYYGIFDITRPRLNAALLAMDKTLSDTEIAEAEDKLEIDDLIGWDKDTGFLRSGGKVIENVVTGLGPHVMKT